MTPRRFDMKFVVKAGIAAVCAALIAGAGVVQPTSAQQPPAATTTPHTMPAQPGPGMGRQMMHGGMGRGMQQGTGSGAAGQCCTDQQMMQMGQQMKTIGQQMINRRANMQDEQKIGRQMIDMGQQMENMGHQMTNEH